jgi:glycerol-3-phosphate acyltransferase PlsY
LDLFYWHIYPARFPLRKYSAILYGIDIQKKGSGNIGFANAVRVLGWKPGLVVLAGDILKGFIPLFIAARYFSTCSSRLIGLACDSRPYLPRLVKISRRQRNCHRAGSNFCFSPVLGVSGLIIYLLGIYFFRKSAPSSIVAAWSLPFTCLFLMPAYVSFYFGLAVIATWTHRANIQQVINEF